MSDIVKSALLILFAVHLAMFVLLWWRRREPYYLAASLTFLLLTATFGVARFVPDAVFGGVSLFWLLRIAAWLSAAVSIAWLIRRRLARRRPGT